MNIDGGSGRETGVVLNEVKGRHLATATLDNSGRSWQSDPLDAIITSRLQQASAFQNPDRGARRSSADRRDNSLGRDPLGTRAEEEAHTAPNVRRGAVRSKALTKPAHPA